MLRGMRTSLALRKFGGQRGRRLLDSPATTRRPLQAAAVAATPERPGVYFLYREERLVFIGLAAPGTTVRRELRRLIEGERPDIAAGAFDCLAADDPVPVYRRCMLRYAEVHDGVLPACNKVALMRRPR
jgi:hypothetical protein